MARKLIHCSYHKCLTLYFRRVTEQLFGGRFLCRGKYKHFRSDIDGFYEEYDQLDALSVNNHALDLVRLGNDFRISRFIRDPRDMVVSGYFYHKRGAEKWCNVVDPKPQDFRVSNMCIPDDMPAGHSLASYLSEISDEEGLIAEIQCRRFHFESMMKWPMDDERIRLFRYENIIDNEAETFMNLYKFYGLSSYQIRKGARFATKFSSKKVKTKHVRNPKKGQWSELFTPRVKDYFNRHYVDLLEKYGYADTKD